MHMTPAKAKGELGGKTDKVTSKHSGTTKIVRFLKSWIKPYMYNVLKSIKLGIQVLYSSESVKGIFSIKVMVQGHCERCSNRLQFKSYNKHKS